ncbi:hypothetical protein BMAJHU_C0771, partial [Burkholderia mallei JHU]
SSSRALRAAATTRAPPPRSATAAARPMPLDAPVTRNDRPWKSKATLMMSAIRA